MSDNKTDSKKKPKSAVAVLMEAANLLHSAKYFTRTDAAFKAYDKSEAEVRTIIAGYRNFKEDKKTKHPVKLSEQTGEDNGEPNK